MTFIFCYYSFIPSQPRPTLITRRHPQKTWRELRKQSRLNTCTEEDETCKMQRQDTLHRYRSAQKPYDSSPFKDEVKSYSRILMERDTEKNKERISDQSLKIKF